MKHYQNMVEMQTFSREDLSHLIGNAMTASSTIRNYKHKGLVQSARKNLHVAVSLETKAAVANRYRIGSSVAEGAYLSHHTAFEYYGLANQVFHEVYVSGKHRFAPFEYDGITYRYIAPRIHAGVVQPPDGVHVTDSERTVLDNINDFEKIGGLEELLHCLALMPYVNEDKLLAYLALYNKQFLYQKTGYILEHFQESLRLSHRFFDQCETHLQKSVRYLYNGIQQASHEFSRRWKLVIPKDLTGILGEGGVSDAEL